MICHDLQIRSSSICCSTRPRPRMQPPVSHLESCAACREELRSLEATFALLDTWQAPEPSPYFDQKLAVRLREEQEMAPAGWLERMSSRLLFNTGRQFRPALAGALALVLLIGGGTVVNFSGLASGQGRGLGHRQDLQILEKNDQAMQTMDRSQTMHHPTMDRPTFLRAEVFL